VTESVAETWLTRQCELIRGVTQGVLVLVGRSGLAARWPEGTNQTADLAAAANAALTERNVVALERLPSALFPLPGCRVAIPFSAGSMRGAIAVEIEDTKEAALGPVVDLLRLGTHWLAVLSRREAESARLVGAFELVANALEHVRFPEAATALATEFATRLDCERVSIGMTRKARIHVEALSHSADFDARAQLMRDLAAAMDEAADQDAVVVHPPLQDSPVRIAREHERLTQQHGTGAALTVPMASDGQIVGAVTFERPPARACSSACASSSAHASRISPEPTTRAAGSSPWPCLERSCS